MSIESIKKRWLTPDANLWADPERTGVTVARTDIAALLAVAEAAEEYREWADRMLASESRGGDVEQTIRKRLATALGGSNLVAALDALEALP
jgi:hypothetical protein